MKINIKHPHDGIFKSTFGDINNARDFLKSNLPPDLAKKLDFKTLHIADTEKRDFKHKKYHLDLSLDCKIAGKETEIYIIFEHKSYQDKYTLIQILYYCVVTWENELKDKKETLTPIIPFIFYHNEKKSNLHKNFRDYFKVDKDLEKYLLSFRMLIFDTTTKSNQELIESSHNLYLVASLMAMKNIFNDVAQFEYTIRFILALNDDRGEILLEYLSTKKDMSEKKFNELIIKLTGDSNMTSPAQIWMDRGKKEGKKEGIKEGMKAEIYNSA